MCCSEFQVGACAKQEQMAGRNLFFASFHSGET